METAKSAATILSAMTANQKATLFAGIGLTLIIVGLMFRAGNS